MVTDTVKSSQIEGAKMKTHLNWFQQFICWLFRIPIPYGFKTTMEIEMQDNYFGKGDIIKSEKGETFYVLRKKPDGKLRVENLDLEVGKNDVLGLLANAMEKD